MTQTPARFGRIVLLALFTALLLMGGPARRASAADTNTIKSITTITTAASPAIEITLSSTRPFAVRDDLILLRVGLDIFNKSHAPADGDLKTVVFVLTPIQFAAVKTGDPVTVYYSSRPPTGADSWNFGKLDKSILK